MYIFKCLLLILKWIRCKGIGFFDLSKYLVFSGLRDNSNSENSASSQKPLHVVVTHTHFDHSGELEKIYNRSQSIRLIFRATGKFFHYQRSSKILFQVVCIISMIHAWEKQIFSCTKMSVTSCCIPVLFLELTKQHPG